MNTNSQIVNQRENCKLIIDSLIRSWNLQGEIANSSEVHLSGHATHCRRKTSFCRIYQNELVDEILANHIELNPSKVERFLDYKFNVVLRSILFAHKTHK